MTTTNATRTTGPSEDDQLVVSAALKRLRAEGWTVAELVELWPTLTPDTVTGLVERRNPWRPFTTTMKGQYSQLLRRAQAHQNARLVRTAVAAHNVVSLADFRARRGARA